jgi:hypothetical protein
MCRNIVLLSRPLMDKSRSCVFVDLKTLSNSDQRRHDGSEEVQEVSVVKSLASELILHQAAS